MGEAVAGTAPPAASVTLRMTPRPARFPDCGCGTVGKPHTSPLVPASGERSVRAQALPALEGLCPASLRAGGGEAGGWGWLATGEFIPEHCVAAVQSWACFWNKEVPNFKAVGCYGQIPSETLALAADGGVSPER